MPPGLWPALVEAMDLSGREVQVLDGLLREMNRRQIAEELGRDEDTIQTHLTRLYRKCNGKGRAGAYVAICKVIVTKMLRNRWR